MPDPVPPIPAVTRSWRTTVLGLGAALVACWPLVIAPLLDEDPATVPQWGLGIAALMGGLGLGAARDHGVSSEKAGAKP